MTMDAPNQRMAKIQAQIREVHATPSTVSSSSVTSEHFISKTIFNDIKSETLLSQQQEHLNFNTAEKSKATVDDVRKGGRKDIETINIPLNDKLDKSKGATQKNFNKNDQSSPLENVIDVGASHYYTHNSAPHRRHRYRRHTISEYTPREDYKLLFANDFDDSKKLSNSKMRVLDSTDSMKNYCSGSTTDSSQNSEGDYESNDSCTDVCNYSVSPSNSSSPTNDEQLKASNTVEANGQFRKREEAGLHLPSYSYGSPAFMQYGDNEYPVSNWHLPIPQTMKGTVYYRPSKCICVRDELESSLTIVHAMPLQINVALPYKFRSEDILVTHSVGFKSDLNRMIQKDKIECPNLDIRMQKILETFQESPHSKYKDSMNFCFEHSKEYSIKMLPSSVANNSQDKKDKKEIVELNVSEIASEEQVSYELTAVNNPMNFTKNNSTLVLHLLNAHRAYYNSPVNVLPPDGIYRFKNLESKARLPLLPQFQAISCSSSVAQELLPIKTQFIHIKPISASKIRIRRNPLRCPEKNCGRMVFVSSFSMHLILDHPHLPMEYITPFQYKSFFLDPHLTHCGITNCNFVYLMSDKITDLGNSQYKDFLPLLVMSSRINLAQMCSMNEHDHHDFIGIARSKEFFLIWITSVVLEDFPISVSLTVCAHKGQVPICHRAYSGEVYSIRNSQEAIDVWKSGHVLLLSSMEMDLLTQGDKQLLTLQIAAH